MRKKIKNNIIEILRTLAKAQDHAELLVGKNQLAQATDLLAQCQACAVEAGEAIERSEGPGTEAVACLETYCEQLYQMSQTADRRAIGSLKRQMEETLKQTRRKIEELPPDPMKVVFMPYKASMWDCMESVWEAAEADPDCEAYVVPIPFYEKNPEGGIERDCYEGDIFPEYVTVTHYKDFVLEREQPDVIYIHNPYDNCNYVTSVYPEYYSSNLKKYTDMLVYISYYFSGNGPLPESHRDLPAYHYADKIILQDQEKVDSLAESIPREKTAALGSPKVDRLLKLEKRRQAIIDEELPGEWRKKIAGKKVILFNISVTGILENSKYAMEKIRYVLSRFKGRDDVVLWWRPHPLIEGTLKSMRPELYGEYMGIKRKYVKEGWGILDESGDAGVAAVVADAYLGESSSSLVHYFGVLGKAVMVTDWGIVEDNLINRDHLYFTTFFKENNSLYFVPSNKGLGHDLYCLDLINGEVKKEITFPGTPINMDACYCGIKKIQNKIILLPHNAEDIYVYEIDKRQATKIVLSEATDSRMLFDKAVEYDAKLFLLPKNYPAIVRLDLQTLAVHEFKECVRDFFTKDNEIPMFTWAYFQKGKYVYMASYSESKMLIFNMENGEFVIKKIGNYSYGYTHIAYDHECFWLAACKANCVVRWNEFTGETREYVYPIEPGEQRNIAYSRLLNMDNEIVICHGHTADIGIINKTTGEYRPCKEAKRILAKIRKEAVLDWGGIPCAEFLSEKEIFMFSWRNSTAYIWNVYTNQWFDYPCRQPGEEMLKAECRETERNLISKITPYCIEENVLTIIQFIDYVKNGNLELFKKSKKSYREIGGDDFIGTIIHDKVVNAVKDQPNMFGNI